MVFERVYEIQKEKKCLVIVDDVWRREDWECLRPALISTTKGRQQNIAHYSELSSTG